MAKIRLGISSCLLEETDLWLDDFVGVLFAFDLLGGGLSGLLDAELLFERRQRSPTVFDAWFLAKEVVLEELNGRPAGDMNSTVSYRDDSRVENGWNSRNPGPTLSR